MLKDYVRLLSLPLWGGSGLKFPERLINIDGLQSPSLGREWIEIQTVHALCVITMSLPLWGGSGLK